MKVRFATLSLSVATAIDHLRDDLKLTQFQGSEETCKFIRIVDELFVRLNGKNRHAVGSKAPLANYNKNVWTAFFKKRCTTFSFYMIAQKQVILREHQ